MNKDPKIGATGTPAAAQTYPAVQIAEPVPDDRARQAVDAIGGYAYQLYQTLHAWIGLREHELLFVEVAEDYAIAAQESLTGVQVRRTASNITLRSEPIVKAINAFWRLQAKNPKQRVTLRYLTTSLVGREQGSSFPNEVGGLEYWRVAARAGADTVPLRGFLQSLPLDDQIATLVREGSDDALRENLLRRVNWECGEPSLNNLRDLVTRDLVWRAQTTTQANVREIEALVDPLLARILHLAANKADRELSSVELDRMVHDRTQTSIPNAVLRQLLAAQGSVATFAAPDIPSDARSRPLPSPYAARAALVDELTGHLPTAGVMVLRGASGLGKSTLARLLARRLGGRWPIIDFRGLSPAESKERLFAALRLTSSDATGIILDDLPVEQDAHIETNLACLMMAARSKYQLIIATCSHTPSNRLLNYAPANVVRSVPNLSEDEVRDLVSALGGDPDRWSSITYAICGGGNPQLVHGRLKRLAREGWPDRELLGGFDPTTPTVGADDERAAARMRLMFELDSRARDLVYRLSVVGTHFDRQLALALAAVPPSIDRPGEALDQAIGPWIEPLGGDYLRLSPLLAGSAKEHLSEAQGRAVQVRIVDELIRRRPLTGSMLSTILIHALACQDDAALTMLALLTLTASDAKKRYVAEQLFGLQFLRTDRLILPKNLHGSVLLREAQFQICVEHEAWDLAEVTAQRLFEEAGALPDDELRDGMQMIALSMVLSEVRLPKSPRGWVHRLLQCRGLLHSAGGRLGEEVRESMERVRGAFNGDIQDFLFVINATRKSTIADLLGFFAELDALPREVRDDLLSAFHKGPGDLKLLLGNAWFPEHVDNSINGQEAADNFFKMSQLAERWEQTRLAVECVVTQSVMLDEYAKAPDAALQALTDAEVRFGAKVELARQRAKVLHRNGDHAACLEVMRTIGDQIDANDYIERTFAFRSAAISASTLGGWAEAIQFYEKARREALRGQGDLQTTAVGLLGDIAGAQVRVGDVRSALRTMKQALKEVARFDPPASQLEYCTRVLICHVPSWMDNELFPSSGTCDFSSLPPGACSRSEINHALLDRRLAPVDVCWYQLAMVEQKSACDEGVTDTIVAWPPERRITSLEAPLTKVLMDRAIQSLSLADLNTKLLAYASSMAHLSANAVALRDSNLYQPSLGAIPSLSVTDLDAAVPRLITVNAVLAFALVSILTRANDKYDGLVDLLRRSFAASAALSSIATHLAGDLSPDSEREASDIIARLAAQLRARGDDLDPDEVFVAQCRLLDWLRHHEFKDIVAPPLLTWTRETWFQIVEQQRFRLRSPNTSVPSILAALRVEGAPVQVISKTLLAAENAVQSNLHPEMRAAMEGLAETG